MCNNYRTAIKPDHAEPPGHAFTIKKLIAVMQRRFRKQLSHPILRLPVKPLRKADAASFARWILYAAAFAAGLQLKAAACRRCGKPERYTAAGPRRQVRDARSQDGVLARRPDQRTRHYYCPAAKIAASLHSPRS